MCSFLSNLACVRTRGHALLGDGVLGRAAYFPQGHRHPSSMQVHWTCTCPINSHYAYVCSESATASLAPSPLDVKSNYASHLPFSFCCSRTTFFPPKLTTYPIDSSQYRTLRSRQATRHPECACFHWILWTASAVEVRNNLGCKSDRVVFFSTVLFIIHFRNMEAEGVICSLFDIDSFKPQEYNCISRVHLIFLFSIKFLYSRRPQVFDQYILYSNMSMFARIHLPPISRLTRGFRGYVGICGRRRPASGTRPWEWTVLFLRLLSLVCPWNLHLHSLVLLFFLIDNIRI